MVNADKNKSLVDTLNWRYATKSFDATRKISATDWQTLEASLHLSPSSFGLQPWKFLVIENKEIRQKLKAVSWDQSQITEASHLVVFCLRKNISAKEIDQHLHNISKIRGVSLDSLKQYREMMLGFVSRDPKTFDVNSWATRQVYIALGFFLLSAASLGIDSCPMEGIDTEQYNKILNLDQQGLSAVVVATAGYRSSDDAYAKAQKVRFDKSSVIARV